MTSAVLVPQEKYESHPLNITVVTDDGSLSARIAWWSDDPVADAIQEAKTSVKLLYYMFRLEATRIVLDGNGKELFRYDTKQYKQYLLSKVKSL